MSIEWYAVERYPGHLFGLDYDNNSCFCFREEPTLFKTDPKPMFTKLRFSPGQFKIILAQADVGEIKIASKAKCEHLNLKLAKWLL